MSNITCEMQVKSHAAGLPAEGRTFRTTSWPSLESRERQTRPCRRRRGASQFHRNRFFCRMFGAWVGEIIGPSPDGCKMKQINKLWIGRSQKARASESGRYTSRDRWIESVSAGIPRSANIPVPLIAASLPAARQALAQARALLLALRACCWRLSPDWLDRRDE